MAYGSKRPSIDGRPITFHMIVGMLASIVTRHESMMTAPAFVAQYAQNYDYQAVVVSRSRAPCVHDDGACAEGTVLVTCVVVYMYTISLPSKNGHRRAGTETHVNYDFGEKSKWLP